MLSHVYFLREGSTAAGIDLDLGVVASGAVPPIEGGAELLAFTDALTTRLTGDITAERNDLVNCIGARRAERAIAVCATFQMMNRALDGVGAPVAATIKPLAVQLGFDPDTIPR
ncbi:MAG: hypothetical protein KJN63_05005 [Acidimicrobiia bacterium]|nr:hypothetical protein [Acidimicrobiia bacterium]